MFAWLRDLTSRERRTMLACWGGWTLDGFDQQLYSYVVPTVIALWGMSTGAAGTIGTVTVVTSSFGGWFAGALADRFGRVRVLQIATRCPRVGDGYLSPLYQWLKGAAVKTNEYLSVLCPLAPGTNPREPNVVACAA